MAAKRDKNSYDNILFVEGSSDLYAIAAIRDKRGVVDNFFIEDGKDVDRAINHFEQEIFNNKKRIIGIVVDADNDLPKRWLQIKGVIDKSKSDINNTDNKFPATPAEIPAEGLILDSIDNISCRVGVWIMPNNCTTGTLEDLLVLLAPKGDKLMSRADEVLNDLEKDTLNKYVAKDRTKAKIYSFLAWQKEPGFPLGKSITSKCLDASSSSADAFVGWLTKLFS